MFDPGTFGKTPLIPFVGMVVGFNSQRKQISGLGWGWRYKVRIIGDYSEKDTIKEQDIRYAIVMLPTTAGSGGGGRLTPVRIAQGDMVFGFYANGDDGLPIITGVFPRTRFHALKDFQQSVWDKITGWYGRIQPGVLGRQEINEQGGASTPTLRSGNKTERATGRENLKQAGLSTDDPAEVGEVKKPVHELPNGETVIATHPDTPTEALEVGQSNNETIALATAEQNLAKDYNDPTKDKAQVLQEYVAATDSTVETAEAAYQEVKSNETLRNQQLVAAGIQSDLNQNREVESQFIEDVDDDDFDQEFTQEELDEALDIT